MVKALKKNTVTLQVKICYTETMIINALKAQTF